MSKRALILWVCFGVLFSAANITMVPESESSKSSYSDSPITMISNSTADNDETFAFLSAAYGPPEPASTHPTISPLPVDESTLWLARVIYSETKQPHEQELVGWVVRNRVETGFRGHSTYKDVVLDPYQFSAFNPGEAKRSFFVNLTPEIELPGWQQALWIAHYVRHADPTFRPFSVNTRHFYSERSMSGRTHPFWVNSHRFVTPGWDYRVNERRFRFYEEIS